jgi:hypothetical protein
MLLPLLVLMRQSNHAIRQKQTEALARLSLLAAFARKAYKVADIPYVTAKCDFADQFEVVCDEKLSAQGGEKRY